LLSSLAFYFIRYAIKLSLHANEGTVVPTVARVNGSNHSETVRNNLPSVRQKSTDGRVMDVVPVVGNTVGRRASPSRSVTLAR
jgi:hypothetical protein